MDNNQVLLCGTLVLNRYRHFINQSGRPCYIFTLRTEMQSDISSLDFAFHNVLMHDASSIKMIFDLREEHVQGVRLKIKGRLNYVNLSGRDTQLAVVEADKVENIGLLEDKIKDKKPSFNFPMMAKTIVLQ